MRADWRRELGADKRSPLRRITGDPASSLPAAEIVATCYARKSTCYDIESDLLCKIASPVPHDNRCAGFFEHNDL